MRQFKHPFTRISSPRLTFPQRAAANVEEGRPISNMWMPCQPIFLHILPKKLSRFTRASRVLDLFVVDLHQDFHCQIPTPWSSRRFSRSLWAGALAPTASFVACKCMHPLATFARYRPFLSPDIFFWTDLLFHFQNQFSRKFWKLDFEDISNSSFLVGNIGWHYDGLSHRKIFFWTDLQFYLQN